MTIPLTGDARTALIVVGILVALALFAAMTDRKD